MCSLLDVEEKLWILAPERISFVVQLHWPSITSLFPLSCDSGLKCFENFFDFNFVSGEDTKPEMLGMTLSHFVVQVWNDDVVSVGLALEWSQCYVLGHLSQYFAATS